MERKEDDLHKMLDDPSVFEQLCRVGMRENRACWIWQDNLTTICVVRRAAPWLRGETNIPPERMVSEVLRPEGDNDLRQTHQRLAFARAVVEGGGTAFFNFAMMKATDYKLIDELELITSNDLTQDARTLLNNAYAYQERALKNGYGQERMRNAMEEKARMYGEVLWKLSNFFLRRERRICGEDVMTDGERALAEKIDEMSDDVAAIARHTKTPPASLKTQMWVLEKWAYYSAHPEALKGAQERKRVYVRDVWEAERNEAQSRGIAAANDFGRILRTAKQGRRRREK